MTWATISLRKMELKNRINQLESEAIQISQELQTASRESSQEQQMTNLTSNYQQSLMYADYEKAMDAINSNKKIDASKKQEAIMKVQQRYNQNANVFSSINESKASSLKNVTDAKTKAIEARKEQVETQLKAANAEYESLGQAMDNDIQKSAIKLA
ncbi:MAG: hypothetical protein E7Z91_05690 [Cyanobacteria bacterium SIG30]|nr:hypothetical protein [Cyanobacteria bacterium SIG30]